MVIRLLMLLFLASPAGMPLLAEEPDAAQPTAELIAEVRRQIERLDADRFADREAAMQQLWLIGPVAAPLLERAAEVSNPEVRYRAETLLRSIHRGPWRLAMEAFAAQPDETLDVEQGMWFIARILNPQVSRQKLDQQLDEIAELVRKKLGEDINPATIDPEKSVAALRAVLFDDLKFAGNRDDYQNPDNSSLERVLATRKGLPILLAHVTIAVGRRLDLPIVGLPVSGMYTVKYDGRRAPKGFPKRDIFFHPYEGGRVLSLEDRAKLFPSEDPEILVPPGTSREVLIRMLNNLTSSLNHKPERAEQLQLATELLQQLRARLQKTSEIVEDPFE